MEDFRRQFTLEAAASLENIAKNLRRPEKTSESFRRETFRTLHTIKGTAQTFGFAAASVLAHALEKLLAERRTADRLFVNGIDLLAISFRTEDFQMISSFLDETGIGDKDFSDELQIPGLPAEIPDELIASLSNQEKTALRSALETGKQLFCLEIGFDLQNFADGLIKFREMLDASGEIIATLPSAKFKDGEKIGFRMLYASSTTTEIVQAMTQAADAEMTYHSDGDTAAKNLQNTAAYAVRYGKEIAARSGKRVVFEVIADDTELAADRLKIVFDVLLHLVRNAVDHAFEREGKIKIAIRAEDKDLRLKISDDGGGINLAAVRDRAIEKNLFSADDVLSERETLDLIFLPEFSTKSVVTEISGRGVGLDAVKALVEKNAGTINVESARGKGTAFEITLPLRSQKSSSI